MENYGIFLLKIVVVAVLNSMLAINPVWSAELSNQESIEGDSQDNLTEVIPPETFSQGWQSLTEGTVTPVYSLASQANTVQEIPESPSVVGLLVIGVLGASLTLKHHQNK